jgi:pre-rRNA-processing protein TSR4
LEPIQALAKICKVCGCRGDLVCSKCKDVHYCGKLHQKIDWKAHKKYCGEHLLPDKQLYVSPLIFSEFGISIEREFLNDQKIKREIDEEKEKFEAKKFTSALNDMSDKELESMPESMEDKKFRKFKKAIENFPSQVLRYDRHSEPLWISDFDTFKAEMVPKCNICNGQRTFEFQIMPQMLNELKIYDLDWGVIAVYTCKNDCCTNGKYAVEFSYKQDIVKQVELDTFEMNNTIVEKETNKKEEYLDQKLDCLRIESKEKIKKQSNIKKNVFMENNVWE